MTTESRWYSETFRNAEANAEAKGRAEGRAEGKAEGRAEGEAKGKAEGRAEGEARIVLRILQTRGIELTNEQRELITGCTDLEQLETWGCRAVTADSAHELFG
jgi:flagellar biosynthesis/type III secretory pathway protein FliH